VKGPVDKPRPCLSRTLSSTLTEVDLLCQQLREFLHDHRLSAASFGAELVARECLNNAVVKGNAGSADKKVSFSLSIGRKWIRLRIEDEGTGIARRKLRAVLPADTDTNGRGIAICMLYADRIVLNRKGNQINLWLSKANKQRNE
jgi:serine/threonine-protein kinase RsbW